MIRESKAEDLPSILALWMESTIHAHPFIEERYWRESESVVRDVYLPAAQTWVWEEEGELKGFASVIDDRFLGALFVAPAAIRSGIGKALVQHVQQRFSILSLEVYQKNQSAVNLAGRDSPPHVDYGLAGGSNAVSANVGPLYFSSHASAVLPAQPFPSFELGRSLVSTLTAPFLQIPFAARSKSGQAPS